MKYSSIKETPDPDGFMWIVPNTFKSKTTKLLQKIGETTLSKLFYEDDIFLMIKSEKYITRIENYRQMSLWTKTKNT